jgi:hypothetical protein
VSGAGATIVLTFVLLALFARRPGFGAAYPRRKLPQPPRAVVWILQWLAAAIFVAALCAGFFGAQDPYRNLLPTMVWVVWWVGFAFVCALIGNLWALLNPLRTLFLWQGFKLPYPPRLAAWPAVVLFFGFAWAELVWRDNNVPSYLAGAVLGYAALTWTGMVLFGRERWLENGEAFSVAFGILGRFAPVSETLELRPPGAGLIPQTPVPFAFMVFVLLMLATVTYDGFRETPLAQQIATAVSGSPLLFRLSEAGIEETQAMASIELAILPLAFLAAFWLTSWLMKKCAPTRLGATEVACAFVLTLVPIAVAYHLSHYFSLLLTAGQFLIPLASDPFGYGWDLFGTAGYKVDFGVVSPYVFWYGAVTLIVAGHVIAVCLAHAVAQRVFGARGAVLSQVPMIVLMVAYTTLSLWILAQPIVG